MMSRCFTWFPIGWCIRRTLHIPEFWWFYKKVRFYLECVWLWIT